MKKGPFLDVTWPPVATPPYVLFLPSSAPPLHIGAVWVCDMSGETWPARARTEERLSEKHNHCSPLVFTRIEFPFSKATWGFSCVFCSNSINFSFSLFTIVPWSFVPRGCYWQLWSTKREERWPVATAPYLNFELLSPWIAFFEWMFCFLWSNAQHQIIASSRSSWSCFGDEIAMNCLVEIYI